MTIIMIFGIRDEELSSTLILSLLSIKNSRDLLVLVEVLFTMRYAIVSMAFSKIFSQFAARKTLAFYVSHDCFPHFSFFVFCTLAKVSIVILTASNKNFTALNSEDRQNREEMMDVLPVFSFFVFLDHSQCHPYLYFC